MAGIGFELKKIYKKDGLSRALIGAMYSSVITIGPTILTIVTILVLYSQLHMTHVSMMDRELLSSTILYIFIFSVCLTSPFNAVYSRYIADEFYKRDLDNIFSSYCTGMVLMSILGTILCVPVLVSMYVRGGVDLPFLLGAYVLWISAVCLFFSITYLHATKQYKIIFVFFLAALLAGALFAWMLFHLTPIDQIHCILYGLALAFFIIATCEMEYIRSCFKGNGRKYKESLQYIVKFKGIFATNLFYILGLYTHNFVFWHTPERLIVANTLISHQAYDMATCLAMFTNISSTVIFTVIAETEFHQTYQNYMEAVIGGTYRIILKNKRIMFNTLSRQLEQVFALQLAITCVIFLFLHIFGITIGFSSMTMSIYPLLCVAYLGVFMMYNNIIYLFYFEDNVGTVLTTTIFLASTLVGTLISKNLQVPFYGAGLTSGMFLAWTFSFFRLRWLERHFEGHIFCRYKVVDTVKADSRIRTVYSKKFKETGSA